MNTTYVTPHQVIVAINRNLNSAKAQLNRLSELLLPGYTPAPSKRSSTPRVARKIKVAKPENGNRIAHLLKTVRLPKERKRKVQIDRLTQEQEDDIVLLLTKTNMTVTQIAEMFKKTRACIYQVRDRRKLSAHHGSPALMAGVQRWKNRDKAPVIESVPAPVSVSAPVLEHVVV